MSLDFVTQLIVHYRYWILIPLSVIEGPIVAFIAGTFASVGFFNILGLSALFFAKDVGLDGIFYSLGYFGNRTSFVHRTLHKIGLTEDHLERVRNFWIHRPGTTMFIGKLAYGISAAFIIVAGMMRMPLKSFFFYGSMVAILQYGTLLYAGYFLGTSFGGTAQKILSNVQYIVGFGALAICVYLYVAIRMRKKFLAEDKELNES